MNRVLSYSILAVVILTFSVGCASKAPYQSDPGKSFALNVMRAAGAKAIFDGKPNSEGGRVHDNSASAGSVGASAVVGAMSNPGAALGVSSLADASLSGLADLVLRRTDPETYMSYFGWMPKSMALTAEEAKGRMYRMLVEAMKEALAETEFPEGYSVRQDEELPHIFHVEGGDCGIKAKCAYNFMGSAPADDFAPDFLGGGASWAWTVEGPKFVPIQQPTFLPDGIGSKYSPIFPDLEVYQRLSSKLPEWMFVYLAPVNPGMTAVSFKTDRGYDFLRQPVLLNQGQVHLFLRPHNL